MDSGSGGVVRFHTPCSMSVLSGPEESGQLSILVCDAGTGKIRVITITRSTNKSSDQISGAGAGVVRVDTWLGPGAPKHIPKLPAAPFGGWDAICPDPMRNGCFFISNGRSIRFIDQQRRVHFMAGSEPGGWGGAVTAVDSFGSNARFERIVSLIACEPFESSDGKQCGRLYATDSRLHALRKIDFVDSTAGSGGAGGGGGRSSKAECPYTAINVTTALKGGPPLWDSAQLNLTIETRCEEFLIPHQMIWSRLAEHHHKVVWITLDAAIASYNVETCTYRYRYHRITTQSLHLLLFVVDG